MTRALPSGSLLEEETGDGEGKEKSGADKGKKCCAPREARGLRGVWTSPGQGSPGGLVGFDKCPRETLWCLGGRGTIGQHGASEEAGAASLVWKWGVCVWGEQAGYI